MKKQKITKIILISGMIFAILNSLVPVLYTIFYHEMTGASTAEEGSIDLSGASTDQDAILDGQWEFYWNQFLVTKPEKDAKSDFMIRVPDYWSRYKINGNYLPSDGFASYRLIMKNCGYSGFVTVYLPDFGSAYRVFIDGRLTAESGILSESTTDVFTTTKAKLYPLMLSGKSEHEVVIEVASTRFSGLYMAPVLKDYQIAIQGDSVRNNLRLILFGTALFSFIVLIVVYIISFLENKRSVWLPVIGFFVLLRIMLTTEFFSFWQGTLFFNLSYEATNPLMFFISFVFKYLLIYLIEELIGIAFSSKEKRGLLIYYTTLFLIYLFTPHGFYNRHLTVLLPVCAFVMEVYAFFKIYHNRQKIKPYGLWVFWGAILAITGLIIDCFYINGNIYLNLSPVLLIMFCVYLMFLSLISSIRTAAVYRDLAVSTAQLTQAKVQIEMQKDYYDSLSSQMNEIRSIRHDVHHFVGVLELLSREKRYEELDQFLSEYVEKADTQPLKVFCENVVANSILGYYSLRFEEKDISFHCVCSIPEQLSLSESDLCIVLGNTLENALEACEMLENPEERYVSVEVKNINGQLLIKITNTYNNELKQRDILLSTKSGRDHGIGFKNIKKVVDAYGGFVKIEHSETVFSLMVSFPILHNTDKDKINLL